MSVAQRAGTVVPPSIGKVGRINPNKSLNEDLILCLGTLPFRPKMSRVLVRLFPELRGARPARLPTRLMTQALFAVLAAPVAISLGT